MTGTATRSLLERLRRLDCCAISDALDRLGLAGVVAGLPQRSGEARVAGVATTVKLGTGGSPEGRPKHLCATAIELSGPDHVIVVEQRTGIDAGCWGGLLTLGAKMKSVAGVVADGPVRDIDEARAEDFPIFCRSTTARTARGRIVEKGTNLPVLIGDVEVRPGDFVIADGSAVAFVAAGRISDVLSAAESIAAREVAMAKAIRGGAELGDVMGASYEHMLQK
jgi:regulator of RNase E activity RraA